MQVFWAEASASVGWRIPLQCMRRVSRFLVLFQCLTCAFCVSHCMWGCRWVLPHLAEVQAGPALCGRLWAGLMKGWDGGRGSCRCREGRLQDVFLCNSTQCLQQGFFRVFMSCPRRILAPVVWEWFGFQDSAPEVSCCRMLL